MLAQSLLSPEDLAIPSHEFEALLKTLKLLETAALIHVRIPRSLTLEPGGGAAGYDKLRQLAFTGSFSMDHWRVSYGCQTVCCIGGTAELVGNCELLRSAERNEPLYDLFYPPVPKPRWAGISVRQAARALRNYLQDGNPDWAGVLRRNSCKLQ